MLCVMVVEWVDTGGTRVVDVPVLDSVLELELGVTVVMWVETGGTTTVVM